MSKLIFSEKSFQKWLFLVGGLAFVLSLLKNIFLEQHPGAVYYVVELLAFLFFLLLVFMSDRNNQHLRLRIKNLQNAGDESREHYEAKISELKEIIAGFEEKENEAARFASYQDKVVGKLVTDSQVRTNKHHFLYLLSELFHGMAVIMYKKEKPSGRFTVETSYGLPEDANPESFEAGEGIHGQAVLEQKPDLVKDVPGDYISVNTGLGESRNYFLYMLPVIKDGECTGLIELLTFRESDVERMWPGVMGKLIEKNIL